MLVNEDDPKTVRGWGVWRTAPHMPWHLMEVHDTKRSAMASAAELLRKRWGDALMVRRVDFGKPTFFRERESVSR